MVLRRLPLGAFLLLFSLLTGGGCQPSPPADPPPGNGNGATEGSGGDTPDVSPPGGPASLAELDIAGAIGLQFVQDVLVFFGADRDPAFSLRTIARTHDMKTWSHRMDIPDAVDRCLGAVRDLAESDYADWDNSTLVIAILSTMSVRDPSALVRNECIESLAWFERWVHPEADKLGRGVDTSDEAVINALRVLDDLDKNPGPDLSASTRLVCIDAVSILGSHPWDTFRGADPSLVRSSLSRPRGVIRRLTARDLDAYRADPEIRDTLDRALIRVAAEVLFMSQVAALADRVEHVRAAGAKALLEASEERVVRHLAFALEREQALTVRLPIITSLERAVDRFPDGRRIAVPALAAALSGSENSVRRAAARALASITEAGHGDDPAFWQRWWIDHSKEYETP